MKQVLLMIAVALVGGCAATPTNWNWVSDPSDPQNVMVEEAIRRFLNKPTGELTKADLTRVTHLSLSGYPIDDAGLKEVAKLQNLTHLDLSSTQITDAGIKDIAKLQKLKFLNLFPSKLTDAGAAELRKAMPNCKIYD